MSSPMPSQWGDIDKIFAGSPTDLMTIGGLWYAPFGTPLPTDVDSPLKEFDEDAPTDTFYFRNLGFISDKGVKINIDDQTRPLDVWGGDQIGQFRDKFAVNYSLDLFQVLSPEVNAAIFGSDMVSTSAATALHGARMKTLINSKLPRKVSLVLDAFYEDKAIRQVAQIAQRANIADLTLVHNGPLTLTPTFQVLRGTDGNHVVQYTDDGVLDPA